MPFIKDLVDKKTKLFFEKNILQDSLLDVEKRLSHSDSQETLLNPKITSIIEALKENAKKESAVNKRLAILEKIKVSEGRSLFELLSSETISEQAYKEIQLSTEHQSQLKKVFLDNEMAKINAELNEGLKNEIKSKNQASFSTPQPKELKEFKENESGLKRTGAVKKTKVLKPEPKGESSTLIPENKPENSTSASIRSKVSSVSDNLSLITKGKSDITDQQKLLSSNRQPHKTLLDNAINGGISSASLFTFFSVDISNKNKLGETTTENTKEKKNQPILRK